jgi:diguanylate cyclase (GGDEF)-like protein/PAS domain S-box-containing protein
MPHILPAARSARPPLVAWLFVSVLGATMAAVLTCTLIIDRFVGDEARHEAALFLQANADSLRDALDRGMAQNYEQVRVIAQLDQVASGTDPASIRRALDQMHSGFPQYAWLGLAGRDGQVIAGTDGLLQGASVAARPWFSGAQHDMFVGDVHRALLLEHLLPVKVEPWRFVDIATPVRAPDGSLRGVLGAHLSWTWAAEIKRDLVDAALARHQAEALIVGADGTVLLGTAALQGRKLPPVQADELSVESHTQGAGRFPGLGWNVVLRQPESVAMADFRALQMRTRVAAALLCVFFAPLLWLLSRRLATPLHELGAQMMARPDDAPPVRGNPLYREADLLGQALDRYARRHREDSAHLRDLNAGLEARVAERTAAQERTNEELTRAVRERRHSEERLRAILTHAPDAYIAIDEAGRISEWNRQAEQTFGWTRDEAIGRSLTSLLVPEGARAAERTGVDAFTRGGAGVGHRVEVSVLHKSGVEIPVQLSAASLCTETGEVAYAFLHDISERKRAERLLAQSERRLRTITDNMPALVSHVDTDLRYTYANATYRRWFDLDEKRLVGRQVRDVVGEQAFAGVSAQMRAALAGRTCSFETEVVVRGRSMHNLIHYIPDVDENGVVQGFYGMVLDLSARRDAELARARSEQRLRTITDNLPVLISYVDKDGRYQFCNGTYKAWMGIEPAQVVGRTMTQLLGEAEYAKRHVFLQRTLAGERTDFDLESTWLGVHRHLRSTYVPDLGADGHVEGVYVLVSDITATKAAEAQLAQQARTDALTGLANRFAFNDELAGALARSRRNEQPIALFFLDVDRFKRINDSLGHGAGDDVLKIFAQRLVASVRETDTVARLAGDEFVVILENLHTPAEPQFIARKILATMNRPFEVDGLKLDITTSIGIAYQADGRAQPAELLALADRALYEAKDNGRNTFRMAAA